ncbi:MAG TPA: biotin/lipoyl-binding protein [Aestuariivirgaceae bacterium]|nr:biotin/lipoyl-binding protein [Aestuariivirgaceae bacterium]
MGGLCNIVFLGWLFGCGADPGAVLSGYVEGEYVAAAPVASARIEAVHVRRGDAVEKGTLLAELDDSDAVLELHQATARLAQLQSQLRDMTKGKRPDEIAAIQASLNAARAQLRESQLAYNRARDLASRGAVPKQSFDQAEAVRATAEARVDELEANLETARSGARPDEIAAQVERVEEANANVRIAQWHVDERRIVAPSSGTISDIIRRSGEIAGPTLPVVSFLPEGAVKLKLFVAEAGRASLKPGVKLAIACDGCPDGLEAEVSYVAADPEFTPPVIYSVDRRQKLLYLVEARPAAPSAILQPGLIVDARIRPEGQP